MQGKSTVIINLDLQIICADHCQCMGPSTLSYIFLVSSKTNKTTQTTFTKVFESIVVFNTGLFIFIIIHND